jgi:hypothetical protein
VKIFCTIFCISNSCFSFAQDVGYTTIGSINHNILIVQHLNDNNKNIRVNERVAVIQMEGAVSRPSLNDTSSKPAGRHAQVPRKCIVVTVTDIETSDGLITSIKISRNLQNSFAINNNASVHLVPIAGKWNW